MFVVADDHGPEFVPSTTGAAKVSPKLVVGKVMQRLKQGEAADAEGPAAPLPATSALPAPPKESKEEPVKPTEGAEVVRLDRFRKK